MTQLTARGLAALRPAERPYKRSDGKGLFIDVRPNGSKYWRMAYRYQGKQKLLALGVYPEVSLAEARDCLADARKELANGIDPMASRKATSSQVHNGFELIAREWITNNDMWSDGHSKHVIRTMEQDVFPRIGSKPITEITTPELLTVIRAVEDRDALDVASRILQRCSSVFRYAIQTGRATTNPALDLKGVLRTRRVQHVASIPPAELPSLISAINEYNGNPVTKYALQLLLLTFVRPGELRGARWDEFDMEKAEWRIPPERMKMDTEHIVPLSRQSIAILRDIEPLTGKSELVFHGERTRKQPISNNTMTYALYRMGYKSRATPHGFRATASSILNEQRFNPDAIERQLSHIDRNQVRSAYTHHARYLEERREIMQWWADYLDSQRNKVIPIKQDHKTA